MYSTCLFCHASLGANEAIEHFPVGRRLAFDGAKGRLWVVCRRCLRWNLTPLEERWEAIEECERAFRETRLRVSTDNIGMARVREGLELVRIGPALRPEIAVWRYGAVNKLRQRKAGVRAFLALGGAAASIGAYAQLAALGPATGLGLFALFPTVAGIVERRLFGLHRPFVLRAGDESVAIPQDSVGTAEVVRRSPGDWVIRLERGSRTTIIEGDEARRQLGPVMSAVNFFGAPPRSVRRAEQLLTEVGDADGIIERLTGTGERVVVRRHAREIEARGDGRRRTTMIGAGTRHLQLLPVVERVALEMAANEETERRAMEGELAILEAAWKEAEEIAAIADSLFRGRDVERRFRAMKRAR